MLKKIDLGYYPESKMATGIEIVIQQESSYEMNLVVLNHEKQKITPEKLQKGIKGLDELSELIDPKSPIVFTINGKGIIHKKIKTEQSDSPATLLNKVFPNAAPADFAIQKTAINPTEAFVSVIRVDVLNDILQLFEKSNLTNISGCYLGPFLIGEIIPLLNSHSLKNESLHLGNFQLLIKENKIVDLQTVSIESAEDILIAENRVGPQLALAFSAALSYFTGNSEGIINSAPIHALKEEYAYKRKFEFRGMVLLGATLLVLIINYFLFNYYWKEGQLINGELSLVENSLKQVEALKLEYNQKKNFLEQNGLLESSRTSFYADQLASNLPYSIQWTELNLHPLKKKKPNSESDVLYFENKIITVAGNCKSSNDLNNWMKEIKKKDWINTVSMVNYKQENNKENGVFLIELMLK